MLVSSVNTKKWLVLAKRDARISRLKNIKKVRYININAPSESYQSGDRALNEAN